jgi:hypothetical protein
MRSLGPTFGGFVFAALLTATPAWAQQPVQPDQPQGQQPDNAAPENTPTQPIPAIRSPLAGAANNGDQDETQGQLQPDTNSISGVAPIGLGSPVMTHNYWAPRLAIAGTADSNPNYGVGGNDWTAFVSVLGGVDVHRASGGSDLFLTYTGGGSFTNQSDVDSGIIQTLSLKDKFLFHRSTFIVFEQISYLPETALGFAGASGRAGRTWRRHGRGNRIYTGPIDSDAAWSGFKQLYGNRVRLPAFASRFSYVRGQLRSSSLF